MVPSTVEPEATTTSLAGRPTTVAPPLASSVSPPSFSPPSRVDPVPATAEEFALALSELERTIRDPAASPSAIEAAGVELQLVYRELSGRRELDEEVIALIDETVRVAAERVIRARELVQDRRAADAVPPAPPEQLPAWTIVEPPPIEQLLGWYHEAEAATGVPWNYLAAIHLQETRMGRIVGTSSAGAVGPMQFLPSTWAACCTGDPTDARDAIMGAATYLAQSGAPSDMLAALHQYNPNDGYVALVSAYAANLADDPLVYRGYHAWQVFYGAAGGDVRLPIGYESNEPLDRAAYVGAHLDDDAAR
jgi:hypothetical protein